MAVEFVLDEASGQHKLKITFTLPNCGACNFDRRETP